MEEKDDFWGEVESEQNESIPSMIITDGSSTNENVLSGVTQSISAQQNQMILMQKPSEAPKIIGVLVILWGGFGILMTLSSPYILEYVNNLLPKEDRYNLTMNAIDYFLALVSILIGLAFIYSGSLMIKRQRFGVHMALGIIIFSAIVASITVVLEPVPPSQEDTPGMHYGLGIGFQIFCSAICFLLAAIPLMVNNAQLEPVRIDPTSQPDWGNDHQF